MTRTFDCAVPRDRERGLSAAAAAIARGALVVVPTDTVYGLSADAFSPDAVADLLAAKGREGATPPPVLIGDVATLDGLATQVPTYARDLVEAFWPGGLTVVLPAQPTLAWDLGGEERTVALRMPLHPVALELLAVTGPLATSGANVTGMPAATSAADAREMLRGAVVVYLDGGPCLDELPSSVVDCTGPTPRLLRPGAIPEDLLREVVPDGWDDEAAPDEPDEPVEPVEPDEPDEPDEPAGPAEPAAPDEPRS